MLKNIRGTALKLQTILRTQSIFSSWHERRREAEGLVFQRKLRKKVTSEQTTHFQAVKEHVQIKYFHATVTLTLQDGSNYSNFLDEEAEACRGWYTYPRMSQSEKLNPDYKVHTFYRTRQPGLAAQWDSPAPLEKASQETVPSQAGGFLFSALSTDTQCWISGHVCPMEGSLSAPQCPWGKQWLTDAGTPISQGLFLCDASPPPTTSETTLFLRLSRP